MAKNTYYFPHDYHARHDPKLERLRMELGPISDGIFWDIVEMLYEEGGYLTISDIPLYSKMLNTDEHMLNKVVNTLFLTDGDRFYNQSLLDRLEHLQNVIEKRGLAGKASGKARQKNTCLTNDEHLSNNREREIKEIDKIDKIKETEVTPPNFSFNTFWDKYPKQVGMSMALMTYRATIKTQEDFDNLIAALKNYMQSKEYKGGFIKNGDRWIEDWRGWIPKKKIATVIAPTQVSRPAPFVQPTAEDRAKLKSITQGIGKI